jgi:hypothetical protein
MKYTIDRTKHQDLVEIMEDSVEYFCNENMVSGELTWIIIQTLAEAKLAQFRGECK